MKVAKQAVKYYMDTTGKSYDDFYSNLDEALRNPAEGELWLINELMKVVFKNGISLDEFKANKDAIRGTVDSDKRKAEGEFYTPLKWCEEGRKYFDKHIPDWHNYTVYDGSCGTANLMRTANHPADKLFLSTLRKEDADAVQKTFPDATVFQLDFLNKLDYGEGCMEFFDQLPERLKEVIRNDEPLIFYMNPPYKSGSARGTDVGKHMCNIGLSRPACDIYYQFMWRVMNIVERFNLSNTWFNCFGPLTFFTGASANILLQEFEHCFEFIDGMCLSAQEFSDTSESIQWGIGCSLWKSRGGYMPDRKHNDILLERKYTNENGEIVTSGRELYMPPREKLSDWVKPKDVYGYDKAPLMTSHLQFKDGEGKVAPRSQKLAKNSLGTLMCGNTLTRSANQSAILSMPTTIQYVDITEENFWRCVSSYTFRRIVEADWAMAKKDLSSPDTTVDGYDLWLRNALVMFLFEWKSMMSSLRNVEFEGGHYTIRNKLFYCSEEEVRAHCTDELILRDLDENPPMNEFMLKMIEESRPYWVEEVSQLFDLCKQYTLDSYNLRAQNNYEGSTECWDAGIQQIRAGVWNDEMEEKLTKSIAIARDWLRRDIGKFGFVVGEDL